MKQMFYLLLVPSEKIEYLLVTLSSFGLCNAIKVQYAGKAVKGEKKIKNLPVN